MIQTDLPLVAADLQSFDQPIGQFYCLVGAVDLLLKA